MTLGLIAKFPHAGCFRDYWVDLEQLQASDSIFVVRFSLENRKAIVPLILDTFSQTSALFLVKTRQQVLCWDEEVVEYTFVQVVFKIFKEHLKAVTQT